MSFWPKNQLNQKLDIRVGREKDRPSLAGYLKYVYVYRETCGTLTGLHNLLDTFLEPTSEIDFVTFLPVFR